jgi:hypothetical protein
VDGINGRDDPHVGMVGDVVEPDASRRIRSRAKYYRQIERSAPRRYPKLASSNSGSKIGSSRLRSAC